MIIPIGGSIIIVPMRRLTNLLLLCSTIMIFASCSRPQAPGKAIPMGRLAQMSPDYSDVTIPSNLCPINFLVQEAGTEVVARFSAPGCSFTYGKGKQVLIDESEWRQLLKAAQGGEITVETWIRQGKEWHAFDPFAVHVAVEPIDSYISYRLIPPSYVSYEELIIEQRNLTNFETQEIYNNSLIATDTEGQCINCHSYQNYKTDRMLFHVRKDYGGTVLVHDGKVEKVNLKTPETLSAGVYPAWHPTEDLVAFSTNLTAQMFHAVDSAKIEVFDGASDLILYDPVKQEISDISAGMDRMECFPTWSPDGRWLYYTVAEAPYAEDAKDPKAEVMDKYQSVRYDLYRKAYDPVSRQWGEEQLVYAASADSMSVSLPRLSPDGRTLVFAMAPYGCFHVWHPNADIYAIDLQKTDSVDGQVRFAPRRLEGINSNYSESYPSFSSNGRWLMAASRRDDGNYTRPYIFYYDASGRCHKAFEVPQETPAYYTLSFKSFNRPEFMVEPVKISAKDFLRVIKDTEAKNVTYVP